jgi:glycosyltransferase involved in cell wall biosynthesis
MVFNHKITLIYTLHDPVPHEEKRGGIAKRIKKRYLEKIFRLSKRNPNFYLHLHSEALLLDCQEIVGKIIIHPHPLPERLVTVRKHDYRGVVFGFLGRMESYKGLDILLSAFEKIAENSETLAPIKILLAGSGDLNVKAWEKLPFDIEIHNRRVSELEFHTYMAGLDCLLLPYRKATQSGVGYLALSYEIPIIATDTGGLPEIVQQSRDGRSTLIPPNDSEALKEAILSFLQKDLRGS